MVTESYQCGNSCYWVYRIDYKINAIVIMSNDSDFENAYCLLWFVTSLCYDFCLFHVRLFLSPLLSAHAFIEIDTVLDS